VKATCLVSTSKASKGTKAMSLSAAARNNITQDETVFGGLAAAMHHDVFFEVTRCN
jgi:hypothetical protein